MCLLSALNEALTAEVQRLKLATADPSKLQQLSINSQMFQLRQQQQATQMNMHHQLQQQSQQVNGNSNAKNEPKQ